MIDAMEGWVSPVELIFKKISTDFNESVDDKIQEVIEFELGAKIDQDEFIKAINYDREQYKKGYQNGYERRDKEIVRCENCKHGKYREDYDDYECEASGCGLVNNADFYCADGDRRDTNECK